jgi:hypothetical protein
MVGKNRTVDQKGGDYKLNNIVQPQDETAKTTISKSDRKLSEARLAPIQVINSHNLKRNDVVIKSILRSMKRYYKTKFSEITDYKKSLNLETLNSVNEKCSAKKVNNYVELLKLDPANLKMVEFASKVVLELGLPQNFENMEFFVLSLSFPNETLKMLQDLKTKVKSNIALVKAGIDAVKVVDSAMNRFSKKVFQTFISTIEIALITKHFLTFNADNLDRIEGFDSCVDLIHNKCTVAIDAHGASLDS